MMNFLGFPGEGEAPVDCDASELIDSGIAHPAIDVRGLGFPEVVVASAKALADYPYFAVLSGLEAGADYRAVEALVRALTRTPPHEKISITFVRIDPAASERGDVGTRYSRTHAALPPHTDASFLEEPDALIAFQMVHSDPDGGGRSMLVPVDDVVDALDPDMVAALREPRFVFGAEGRLPILWDSGGSECIRYYRMQIETALRAGGEEDPASEPLFDRLDALLARLALRRKFALADGEVLLINNRKVLHARTAMAPDSDRLMYRFRPNAQAQGH